MMMTIARARKLLDVETTTDWNEVRQAYRDLARVWHPDRFQEPRLRVRAERQMAELNAAYALLEAQWGSAAMNRPFVERRAATSAVHDNARYAPGVKPSRRQSDRHVSVPTTSARAWLGRVAVCLAVVGAMTLAMSPRLVRPDTVALAPTAAVSQPAIVQVSAPVPTEPAVVPVQSATAEEPIRARSFIDRETDAVIGRTR